MSHPSDSSFISLYKTTIQQTIKPKYSEQILPSTVQILSSHDIHQRGIMQRLMDICSSVIFVEELNRANQSLQITEVDYHFYPNNYWCSGRWKSWVTVPSRSMNNIELRSCVMSLGPVRLFGMDKCKCAEKGMDECMKLWTSQIPEDDEKYYIFPSVGGARTGGADSSNNSNTYPVVQPNYLTLLINEYYPQFNLLSNEYRNVK